MSSADHDLAAHVAPGQFTAVHGDYHPAPDAFTPRPAEQLTDPNRPFARAARTSPNVDEKDRGSAEADSSTSDGKDVESNAQKEKSDEKDEEKDPNIVEWDGPDDPQNPQNWPMRNKWLYSFLLSFTTFTVTFASSVYSAGTEDIAMEFSVSPEVATLGLALYVLGFAWGPIAFGPLSELYGRKLPMYCAYVAFAVFQIPVALAQNIYTIMICRFLGGFFGSAPLAIIGGYLADFHDPVNRGVGVVIFSGATFLGPTCGPIIGGFLTMSYLGWRWNLWITLIMATLFGSLACIIVPESYSPVLLKRKAAKLRSETKQWAIHAKSEEESLGLKGIFDKYMLRPAKMVLKEPILTLITLYMSFIYGLIYLFFEAYPVAFREVRMYNLGVSALPFIGIMVGVFISSVSTIIMTKTRFKRITEEKGTIIPEERLIPMMAGALLLPIGLFWFGWTSSPHITPWPQIIAGAPIGAGIQLIFMQGITYIIDVYGVNANSALAANTFLRSWFGAGFPVFATGMYHNLGVPWASSLLGFLAVALVPVPFVFYRYGAKIRSWSTYSM